MDLIEPFKNRSVVRDGALRRSTKKYIRDMKPDQA